MHTYNFYEVIYVYIDVHFDKDTKVIQGERIDFPTNMQKGIP